MRAEVCCGNAQKRHNGRRTKLCAHRHTRLSAATACLIRASLCKGNSIELSIGSLVGFDQTRLVLHTIFHFLFSLTHPLSTSMDSSHGTRAANIQRFSPREQRERPQAQARVAGEEKGEAETEELLEAALQEAVRDAAPAHKATVYKEGVCVCVCVCVCV